MKGTPWRRWKNGSTLNMKFVPTLVVGSGLGAGLGAVLDRVTVLFGLTVGRLGRTGFHTNGMSAPSPMAYLFSTTAMSQGA